MGSVINSNKNNNKNNNKNDEYIYYVSITFKPFDNFNRFINNSIIQNMSDLNSIGDIMRFENLTNLTDLFDIIIMRKYRVLYKSDNFYYTEVFNIDGLFNLRNVSIGSNSFTQKKNSFGNDSSKSFHILNCDKLESISIGEYSFSDYGGEFELSNLPQLQSIQIGQLNSNSYNFYYLSNFEIQSISIII